MTRDEINKLDKHLTNLENNWLDNEYENYQESGLHELEWTDAKAIMFHLKKCLLMIYKKATTKT